MTMPVTPGGAYFWLHSDFGDIYRGEAISYNDAVASVAGDGAKDVADLAVPSDFGDPSLFSGHPKNDVFTGDGYLIDVGTTYDNGTWDDGTEPWVASEFIVELQGSAAESFLVTAAAVNYGINHYVSTDSGQHIYLESSTGLLLSGVTGIKVWRATFVPGPPGDNFWTNFVGAREIP